MDNFERRLANSMKAAAEQMPSSERRVRHHRAGLIALAAAVLVGAVIAGTTWLVNPGDSASPAEPAPDGVINLEGKWVLTALSDGDGKPMLDPKQFDMPNVTFSNGEVTIDSQVRCFFTAEYSQSGERGSDLRFTADSDFMVRLDASCPAEKGLFSSLDRIRHVSESNGALTLLAEEGVTIATLKRVSTYPINLEGDWALDALTDAEGNGLLSRADADEKKIRLRFADGQLSTAVSCYEVTGSYRQPNERDLSFMDVKSDIGLGPDECDPTPLPLADRLKDVRHVSSHNGRIYLHAETWMIIAVLERAEAPFTVPEFPCSASDRQPIDLDVPGPGQPTPEMAVGPYADGKQLVPDPSNPNVVYAVNSNGTTYRVFRVTKQGDGWWPDGYTTCRPGAATPSGDPDPAVWELAPGQTLTEDSTEFDVLVTRSGCNSGVTGEVSEPVIDFETGGKITVSFTVPHSDGGFCPGNDAVPVTVRLGEPIGYRALVDGQCSNTNLATTAFCKPSRGVRWAAQ